MNREIGDYIQDVIDAITKSMEFIDGMEYEESFMMIKPYLQLYGL